MSDTAWSACAQESYRQVMRLRPKDLRKKMMIRFRHEDGVDYGGIARWVGQWVWSRECLKGRANCWCCLQGVAALAFAQDAGPSVRLVPVC